MLTDETTRLICGESSRCCHAPSHRRVHTLVNASTARRRASADDALRGGTCVRADHGLRAQDDEGDLFRRRVAIERPPPDRTARDIDVGSERVPRVDNVEPAKVGIDEVRAEMERKHLPAVHVAVQDEARARVDRLRGVARLVRNDDELA